MTDPRAMILAWLVSLGWAASPTKRWPFRAEKEQRDVVLMLKRGELPFVKVCGRKPDGTFDALEAGMAWEVLPRITHMERTIRYPDGRVIMGQRNYTLSGRALIIHGHCPAHEPYAELNVWGMSYNMPAELLDLAWDWIGRDDEQFPTDLWRGLIDLRMHQEMQVTI